MHYTVFAVPDVEMDQSVYEGNWVRAAELADWQRKFVVASEAAETEVKKFTTR